MNGVIMNYQSIKMNFIDNNIIPLKLLGLFILYNKEVTYNDTNLKIYEENEEYIILNKNNTEKTFNELLFEYINEFKICEVDLYKKATIDRRLFSKIRSDRNYHPSFGTITLLALAMNLSTDKFITLLNSASYSLPQNSYINIALKYCFDEGIYDIIKVNNILFNISGKTLKEL